MPRAGATGDATMTLVIQSLQALARAALRAYASVNQRVWRSAGKRLPGISASE